MCVYTCMGVQNVSLFRDGSSPVNHTLLPQDFSSMVYRYFILHLFYCCKLSKILSVPCDFLIYVIQYICKKCKMLNENKRQKVNLSALPLFIYCSNVSDPTI